MRPSKSRIERIRQDLDEVGNHLGHLGCLCCKDINELVTEIDALNDIIEHNLKESTYVKSHYQKQMDVLIDQSEIWEKACIQETREASSLRIENRVLREKLEIAMDVAKHAMAKNRDEIRSEK